MTAPDPQAGPLWAPDLDVTLHNAQQDVEISLVCLSRFWERLMSPKPRSGYTHNMQHRERALMTISSRQGNLLKYMGLREDTYRCCVECHEYPLLH